MNRENIWKSYDASSIEEMEKISREYKECLDAGKTERECVKVSIDRLEKAGYRSFEAVKEAGQPLKAGDKVYAVCMNKAIAIFHMGKQPLEAGMNILGAHIDSPRIDIKQNPLYESDEMAYLDTHYYGGIKKYQWVATPLALHGVIAKKDGTVTEVAIGEKEDEPVFLTLINISEPTRHISISYAVF